MSKSPKKATEENVTGDSVICEKALLIGIQYPDQKKESISSHLKELKQLVDTMGIPTAGSLLVSLKKPTPRFLIGSGKVQEIIDWIRDEDIDILIFDDDLSPSQQRNLENETDIAVIDRREVILDIFAGRASSRESVLQVALARMEYSLPRLTRAWTHLSRQKGGTKGTRGEGETQLEVDRRIVQNRILALKKELISVHKNRSTQRKKRSKDSSFTVSIVGYTNAGKSTLINKMCEADVFTEDKLFATLDPSTRKLMTESGKDVLLTDTVGFIRKLPHNLIEAFKSTLEEAVFADLILHVLDISSDEVLEHNETTLQVLKEIGAENPRIITILNKADKLENPQDANVIAHNFEEPIIVSAINGQGLDDIKEAIVKELKTVFRTFTIKVPQSRYDLVASLYDTASIEDIKYEEDSIIVQLTAEKRIMNIYRDYLIFS